MDTVSEAALEAIGVEEGQEELEVLLFPVVRGGGEEEEMSGVLPEEPSQFVPLGLLDFAAEEVGRHLVSLVHDHEVPVGLVVGELRLHVFVPAELIQPAEDQGIPAEGVRGLLQAGPGDGLEVEAEAIPHFILPLLHQVPRTDNEAAVHVSPHAEFFDEESCHDGLAGAWVVSQKESERLTGEHFPIDRCDLVGEGIEDRRVDGEEGVEQMREVNPVRFRDQAKEAAIRLEGP